MEELLPALAFVLCMFGIGLYFKRRASQSMVDYWVAGRTTDSIVGGIALEATFGSAHTFIGVVGLGYSLGLVMHQYSMLSAGWGYFLATLLLAAPLRKFSKFTLFDYLTARYDSKLIGITAPILVIVLFIPYIVAQLSAAGLVISHVSSMSYTTAVVLMTIIYFVYVALGGMHAITWANLIQGLLMISLTLVPAILVVCKFDGVGNLFVLAKQIRPDIGAVALSPLTIIGSVLTFSFFALGLPTLVSRLYSARNERTAAFTPAVAALSGNLIFFCAIPIILASVILFPSLELPDMAFMSVFVDVVPRWFIGFGVVGVIAALLSTIDSMLLTIGAAVVNDIYKKYVNPDVPDTIGIRWAMIISVIAACIAMVLSFKPPALIGILVSLVAGGIGSTFAFPVALGVWWKRTNKWGALVGMLGGFISFAVLTLGNFNLPLLSQVVFAIPISALLTILVSLVTQKPSVGELDQGYYSIHN